MHQYFYSNGKDKVGPVPIEVLKEKKITESTLVWRNGLEGWVKAKELPELAECIQNIPPPLPSELLYKQKSEKIKHSIFKYALSEKLWFAYAAVSVALSLIVLFADFVPDDSNLPVYKTNWQRQNPFLYGLKLVFYTFLFLAPITLIVGIIQGFLIGNSNHSKKT